ncbi:hypothetical protein LLG46_13575 [bacterium]|nr:hypothetical protein [bacterium]
MVRSDKKPGGSDMDKTFARMNAEFGDKIEFRRLNWEERAGKGAIESLSLAKPPASVLADCRGHVVEKFEGVCDATAIKDKLSNMIESNEEKTK